MRHESLDSEVDELDSQVAGVLDAAIALELQAAGAPEGEKNWSLELLRASREAEMLPATDQHDEAGAVLGTMIGRGMSKKRRRPVGQAEKHR